MSLDSRANASGARRSPSGGAIKPIRSGEKLILTTEPTIVFHHSTTATSGVIPTVSRCDRYAG